MSVFCRADTSTVTVWPPHSSGIRPSSVSSRLTRSGCAFGLSILLIATTIGTFAALAWSIASFVCGITPSSAATTRTTMSVTLAPRARISVNAAWPGVSRNTMFAAVDRDVIRADVLRDAAGLALGDPRRADGVEQAGLAVVDVAHDGDDRRAQDDVLGARFAFVDLQQLLFEAPHLHVGAELARDHRRGLGVERRVDRQHQPLHQQLGEHVLHAQVELVRQILHRHAFGERDGPGDRRRRRRASAAAPGARARGAAPRRAGRRRPDAADTTAATACRDAADTAGPGAAACRAAAAEPAATGSGRGPPIGGRELGYGGRG